MKQIVSKIIIVILTFILFTVGVVYSARVWSDDFDDKNIDDWETELLDWDAAEPFTGEAVEFDLSDGTLKAPGNTPGNIWYLATHQSDVEYGNWTFDVNVVDTPEMHFYVFLMADDWADYPSKGYSYDLIFITQPDDIEPGTLGGVVLFKRDGWSARWKTIGEWGSTEDISGWHHVEVTRDTNGVFDVYLDGELIIHVEDEDPISGMFTTFRFEANSGPEIDNVIVSDLSVEEPIEEPPVESGGGQTDTPILPGFPVLSLGVAILMLSLFFRKEYHQKQF